MRSALLLLPLAALALTSCVGEGAEAPSIEDGVHVAITDQQGSVEGFVGAAEDAEIELCKKDGSTWTAGGTVTNPKATEQSYRLYVAFNENRDTRGLVQVDVVAVAAGATEPWSAEAPIESDDLTCVLRVERFEPRG